MLQVHIEMVYSVNVQLEFIVAALLDMEEVDGGSGALLVSESASSPDVATRSVCYPSLSFRILCSLVKWSSVNAL